MSFNQIPALSSFVEQGIRRLNSIREMPRLGFFDVAETGLERFRLKKEDRLDEDLQRVLETETCPYCYRAFVDSESNEFIALECKVLDCVHVAHYSCWKTHGNEIKLHHDFLLKSIRCELLTEGRKSLGLEFPLSGTSFVSLSIEFNHILSDFRPVVLTTTAERQYSVIENKSYSLIESQFACHAEAEHLIPFLKGKLTINVSENKGDYACSISGRFDLSSVLRKETPIGCVVLVLSEAESMSELTVGYKLWEQRWILSVHRVALKSMFIKMPLSSLNAFAQEFTTSEKTCASNISNKSGSMWSSLISSSLLAEDENLTPDSLDRTRTTVTTPATLAQVVRRSLKEEEGGSPVDVSFPIAYKSLFDLLKSQPGLKSLVDRMEDPSALPSVQKEMMASSSLVQQLMVHSLGHYAVEKLYEKMDFQGKLELLRLLRPSGVDALSSSSSSSENEESDGDTSPEIQSCSVDEKSYPVKEELLPCHKQGSFTLQALMDLSPMSEKNSVLVYAFENILRPQVRKIITSSSGHYVILKFIQLYPFPHTRFLIAACEKHCAMYCSDHYGLRVLKALFESVPVSELHGLFKKIARLTLKIVENQYGNYVVQQVLEIAPASICTSIKMKMEGKFVRLAKQKFSSNVVETCLNISNNEWRTIIIRELASAAGKLIRDRYGNYVLQTALSVSEPPQIKELTKALTPHLGSLRENVRNKWKSILKAANEKCPD
jgi:hypothetical protein